MSHDGFRVGSWSFEVGSWPVRGQTHCWHVSGQTHDLRESAESFLAMGLDGCFGVWVFLILI